MPDLAESGDGTLHLVERAAVLLRAEAGLAPRALPAPRPAAAPPQAAGPALDLAALRRAGLALAGARSRVAEEYRIAVGRMLRALGAQRPQHAAAARMVMVTSARPGEGKSFSALNLAASMAQNGQSEVLLVDLDGKPNALTALFGLRDRPGLFDLARTAALSPEALVVPTALDGLSVLPLGQAGEGGAVTHAIATALARVQRHFARHVLLLDTAPCLSTSDPSTLAPLVDQVVMVVEAGRTQRSELTAALDLVKACPSLQLVLNKVRLTHRHSFGSYYYFGQSSQP